MYRDCDPLSYFRVSRFKESVIREMTRLALVHGAVNLAQGFPDFPAPPEVKGSLRCDYRRRQPVLHYLGRTVLPQAIADYYRRFYAFDVNPETEIAVCCGATEGMVAALLGLLNEGDEIIVFEPFYENYWPDSQLSGARIRYVSLNPPHWGFDPGELRAAFSPRTRAIILNSPNNPTGRVFTRDELTVIAGLCQEFDILAITDEIYEHIVYEGARHIPIATLPGTRERSVLVNSLSKTFSVTGWRVGWVIAPPELTTSVRKVHDFLTVGAAAPLQQAGVLALSLPHSYFTNLSSSYEHKRNLMLDALQSFGFVCSVPARRLLCNG